MKLVIEKKIWWLVGLLPPFASTAIMYDATNGSEPPSYVTFSRAGFVVILSVIISWLIHEVLTLKAVMASNDAADHKSI